MEKPIWQNVQNIVSKTFVCGQCNAFVASDKGYYATIIQNQIRMAAWLYICPSCSFPNFIDSLGNRVPSPLFGNSVEHISHQSVADLYEEARRCFSVNAFTAVVMCCRKLLMNIAVEVEKAEMGKTFVFYIDFLERENIIPKKKQSLC